jgi:uncharacterized membrane protein YdjX (TVP38/TMEM64 family)
VTNRNDKAAAETCGGPKRVPVLPAGELTYARSTMASPEHSEDAPLPSSALQAGATSETPAVGKAAGRARWTAAALAAGSLFYLGRQLPLSEWIEASRETVEGLGLWGPVAFGVVYIVATVRMVPGVILTLAAGALFGSMIGTATVSISSVSGAAIAFLIARHLARERVERRLSDNRRFAAIDRAIGEQGWKIVGLLRLSPAMPFSLSNYLYGLTAVPFWPYVGVSAIAMLPATFLYVYLGDLSAKGVEAAVGAQTGSASGFEWTLRIVGLVATVAVTLYVTKIARRAIQQQTQIETNDDTSGDGGTRASSGPEPVAGE